MDLLLSQQIEDLKQKQLVLENQLCSERTPVVDPCADVVDYHQIHEISPSGSIEVEKWNSRPGPQTRAAQLFGTEGTSLRDHLEELQRLNDEHQRRTRQAIQTYFSAVSDYPAYQQRRERQLKGRPFSFALRDLARSPGPRARRAQAARQQSEAAQAQFPPFQARPVPPTTFMNKYDLMVQEWREQRQAVRRVARARAERAHEESVFLRLSAEGLRGAREELLGGVRRRAQSAGGDATPQPFGPAITQPEDIALEVRMRFWPAIKEHEQVRKERIKQRAVELKQEVEEHRRKVIPMLSQPTPIRLFAEPQEVWFGVGRPLMAEVGSVAASPAPVPSVPGGLQVPTPAPTAQPQPSGAVAASDVPSPPVTAALEDAATAVGASEKPSPTGRDKATLYNPNLVFRPNIRPGVPQFHKIWAHNLAEAASVRKKKKPQATVPQPFTLTPSAKDVAVCEKRLVRSASQPVSKRTPPARARPARLGKPPRDGKNQEDNGDDGTGSTQLSAIPKGTRAHALRTEMVYSKYIKKSKEKDDIPEEEQVYLKELAKRRREVSKRLAQYIGDPHTEREAMIRSKLKELRATMKESEKSAQMRLKEMKERVAQLPPIFVEPTRVNSLAKARVEAEQEILKMLKQSGLDAGTIRDIITRPIGADSTDNENAAEFTTETVMPVSDEKGASVSADGVSKAEGGALKPSQASKDLGPSGSSKSSGSSSSSSSASFSSSSSSASQLSLPKKGDPGSNSSLPPPRPPGVTDTPKVEGAASPAVPKGSGYSDDSFEESSSNSSA